MPIKPLHDRVLAKRLESEEKTKGGIIIPDTAKEKPLEGKGAFGYNAASDQYEDLIAAGIIDPAKVVRSALQNAASVSGLMITTESLVAEKPKKEKGHGAPHGHGMDGMDMM